MQLPHVFIAFWAREERFPHGFIACSLFSFLGLLRRIPRAIFYEFWGPLRASWGALGVSLVFFGSTLSALWRPLGDHFCLLGLRLALLLLAWHAFGYDFGDPEIKIKRITAMEHRICT